MSQAKIQPPVGWLYRINPSVPNANWQFTQDEEHSAHLYRSENVEVVKLPDDLYGPAQSCASLVVTKGDDCRPWVSLSSYDADLLKEGINRLYAAPAGQGEPVAVVDESDDGMLIDFIYGENGSPLKRGDKLYAEPDAGGAALWKAQAGYNQETALRWHAENEELRAELAKLRKSHCSAVVLPVLMSRDSVEHPRNMLISDGFRAGMQWMRDQVSKLGALYTHPAPSVQSGEPVGEIVAFGHGLHEVSWARGRMPELGVKLYAQADAGSAEQLQQEVSELEECLRIKAQLYDKECAESRSHKAEADRLRDQLDEAVHLVLELSGAIAEYQVMPVRSLEERMFSTLVRYKGRITDLRANVEKEKES